MAKLIDKSDRKKIRLWPQDIDDILEGRHDEFKYVSDQNGNLIFKDKSKNYFKISYYLDFNLGETGTDGRATQVFPENVTITIYE